MMTGALLGGAPVAQAARLQMVIMFMIAASSALAAILVTGGALLTIVDAEHRVRAGRVDARKHWVWRGREHVWAGACKAAGKVRARVKGVFVNRKHTEGEGRHENGERNGLLG